MNQIIIGLEAHDGSGKSTTAEEIQTLFNGEVFFTKDEMKNNYSDQKLVDLAFSFHNLSNC